VEIKSNYPKHDLKTLDLKRLAEPSNEIQVTQMDRWIG